MKGRGFPWSRLLLVLLVFAAGFLLHDVRTHGSFQASSSARLLRSSGVLPASQQAWQKVSHCCLEGYRSVAPALGGSVRVWVGVKHKAISCREPFLLGKRSPGLPGSAFSSAL
ncbi:hypothetical protein FQV09_0013603, partial [Eudyptes chrysolophus]